MYLWIAIKFYFLLLVLQHAHLFNTFGFKLAFLRRPFGFHKSPQWRYRSSFQVSPYHISCNQAVHAAEPSETDSLLRATPLTKLIAAFCPNKVYSAQDNFHKRYLSCGWQLLLICSFCIFWNTFRSSHYFTNYIFTFQFISSCSSD